MMNLACQMASACLGHVSQYCCPPRGPFAPPRRRRRRLQAVHAVRWTPTSLRRPRTSPNEFKSGLNSLFVAQTVPVRGLTALANKHPLLFYPGAVLETPVYRPTPHSSGYPGQHRSGTNKDNAVMYNTIPQCPRRVVQSRLLSP